MSHGSLMRSGQLRAERKWRSSGLEDDLKAFKSMKNRTTWLMNSVRCEFYTNFINKNSDDQRKLFCATKKLLNKCAETPFPPHSDKLALANDMGAYFAKKISDIRVELDSAVGNVMPTTPITGPPVCAASLCQFDILDEDAVRKLENKAPTKSCPLDPVPASVLKDCLDELLPFLTKMLNSSLQSGVFPDFWKEALINPTLKRDGSRVSTQSAIFSLYQSL